MRVHDAPMNIGLVEVKQPHRIDPISDATDSENESEVLKAGVTMNNKQLVVAWVMGALIVLACLIPPWEYTFQISGISQVTKPAGYSLMFAPPNPEGTSLKHRQHLHGVVIDFGRLGLELIVISVLGGLSIFTTGWRSDGASGPK